MVSTRPTVASELVEWAFALDLAAVPDDLLELLKLRLLDTTGLILLAWEFQPTAAVRTVFEQQGGEPESRLLVRGALPASSAAAVHGSLAHAFDFDDTMLDSLLHASSVVFPTIYAVGDANDVSGADALTTSAAAYEVAARLGAAAGRRFHERGFHATGVLGPLFAAVAAARLYELEPSAAVSALGIAGSMGSGLLEFLSDGSSTKRLHPGWASHAGILAARLAGAGFTGPASILEGPFGIFASYLDGSETDLDDIRQGLGQRWLSRAGSFKLYPCAHVLHPYIDAALDLHRSGRLENAVIAAIAVTMPDLEVALFARPHAAKAAPRTEYESRTSLPYVLAAACVDGAVGIETFTEPAYARPAVVQLANAVEVESSGVRSLTLEFADGTVLAADVEAAAASTGGRPAVIEKFERNAAVVLEPEAAERLRDAILAIEERPLRDVISLARVPERTSRG